MTITAKIIADSISPKGIRLTTMQLRYPRFIHAEFMTHRVFSRNASSSRAIPVNRLIEDLKSDTAMPIDWGRNQRGMQAGEECNEPVTILNGECGEESWIMPRDQAWKCAAEDAAEWARRFMDAGYHKQIVNRMLEPFSHINVVVTATDWANFFALRDHPDAQPEIAELARQMRGAMENSTPAELEPGDWHLPYIKQEDWDRIALKGFETDEEQNLFAAKISAARCARVSYLTHEGRRPTIEEDLQLYDRLVTAELVHASPLEHQATPDRYGVNERGITCLGWSMPRSHGNFRGWVQHRKLIPNEAVQG